MSSPPMMACPPVGTLRTRDYTRVGRPKWALSGRSLADRAPVALPPLKLATAALPFESQRNDGHHPSIHVGSHIAIQRLGVSPFNIHHAPIPQKAQKP